MWLINEDTIIYSVVLLGQSIGQYWLDKYNAMMLCKHLDFIIIRTFGKAYELRNSLLQNFSILLHGHGPKFHNFTQPGPSSIRPDPCSFLSNVTPLPDWSHASLYSSSNESQTIYNLLPLSRYEHSFRLIYKYQQSLNKLFNDGFRTSDINLAGEERHINIGRQMCTVQLSLLMVRGRYENPRRNQVWNWFRSLAVPSFPLRISQ
jgi:hypothetical protein